MAKISLAEQHLSILRHIYEVEVTKLAMQAIESGADDLNDAARSVVDDLEPCDALRLSLTFMDNFQAQVLIAALFATPELEDFTRTNPPPSLLHLLSLAPLATSVRQKIDLIQSGKWPTHMEIINP